MPIPGDPGYYVQDNAPYLRYYDGATYDPWFACNSIQTVVSNALSLRRSLAYVSNPISPNYGRHFVYKYDGTNHEVDVFSGVYGTTLEATIDINAAIANINTAVIINCFCYDPNKDNIYFTFQNTLLAAIRIGVIDCSVSPPVVNTDIYGGGENHLISNTTPLLTTAATTLNFTGATQIVYNPVNNKKYVMSYAGLRLYIIDATDKYEVITDAMVALCAVPTVPPTINPSRHMCIAGGGGVDMTCLFGNSLDTWVGPIGLAIDPNGDVWVASRNTEPTTHLICIDGTKSLADGLTLIKSTTDLSPYATTDQSIANTWAPLAIFPGDGITNPYVLVEGYDSGGPTSNLISVGLDGVVIDNPYPGTRTTLPLDSSIGSMWWSILLNCFVVTDTNAGSIFMMDKNGDEISAVDYTPILPTLPPDMTSMVEDTLNRQFIGADLTTTDNLFYIFDSDTTITCDGGFVKMYLGADGPYQWDSSNLEWAVLASVVHLPVTPSASQFTVTATLDPVLVTTAALMVSTDYGFTWTTANDTGGALYANPASWLAGRIYNNIAGLTNVKVTFTTTSNCGLESANISI
jgi:hypothetical protein